MAVTRAVSSSASGDFTKDSHWVCSICSHLDLLLAGTWHWWDDALGHSYQGSSLITQHSPKKFFKKSITLQLQIVLNHVRIITITSARILTSLRLQTTWDTVAVKEAIIPDRWDGSVGKRLLPPSLSTSAQSTWKGNQFCKWSLGEKKELSTIAFECLVFGTGSHLDAQAGFKFIAILIPWLSGTGIRGVSHHP